MVLITSRFNITVLVGRAIVEMALVLMGFKLMIGIGRISSWILGLKSNPSIMMMMMMMGVHVPHAL